MNNDIANVKISPCCVINNLPMAFGDGLSYLEVQCTILNKLNEVINQVNINTDFINNWQNNLDEINERLTNLENEFDNLEDNVYKYIDDKFLQAYNELLTMINNMFQSIKDSLNADLLELKIYIDNKDKELQEQIDNIVIGKIDVYNPVNGKIENIQNVINDIYGYLRYGAITCTEFDVSGITAQEFDNLNLTTSEFDLNSKNYIGNYNKYLNLATGKYEDLQSILNTLFGYHQVGITVTSFESLELTCDTFDEKEITAYQFDFESPLVV